MLFGDVTIEAISYQLPPHRITSAAIESQISGAMANLQIPKGTFESLTGIRERRFWDPGVMPSDVATLAARKVIEVAGIDPKEIGCLINTSVCRDFIEPSVACLVHGNLKLFPHCLNYDIGNACLGFLNGMSSIIFMIEAGLIKYGLVVDGEGSREVVEMTIKRLQSPDVSRETFYESFATLTLGSGAVAMLLCHKDISRTGHLINGSVCLAATEYNRLTFGQKDYMKTDSMALMKAGMSLARDTWKLASTELEGWSDETIDLYAPHQVSKSHMDALTKTLGITPEKVFLNFYTHGNIGPAAVPITLAMAEEAGRIQSSDHVALLGIGSGLNCSGMSITW